MEHFLTKKVFPSVGWIYDLVWEYLALFQTQCVLFYCVSVCVIWHLANPTTTFVLCGDKMKSFFGTRRVYAAQSLCINCRVTACYGGPMPTIEADLVLLLNVSKVLFQPVLDCILFSLVILIEKWIRQKCLHFWGAWVA